MRKTIILFCICTVFISLNSIAQVVSLISAGSTWKYNDSGSNLGTSWRTVAYNDNAWSSGLAQLGYGDGDEATVVSYGTNSSLKHVTTYFRKAIIITSASAYSGYTISLKKDDGAVVYVNGTRVVRSNLPSGYNYSTLANSTISGSAESNFINYTISASLFISGTNVIAVEIHQRSRTDVDISFDFKLDATSAPCTVPGGFTTTNITVNSATLNWNIVAGAIGYNVQYRLSGNGAWTSVTTSSNSLIISSLNSGSSYEYMVQTNCGNNQSLFSLSQFFTTNVAGPLTDSLIQQGTSWKYLDSGSAPASGWKDYAFVETGWNTGNSELGYGDGGEATIVSFGPNSSNKYVTTYFRKTFTTTNASAYTSLALQIVRDDGVVVYLNGTEVYRNNMPSGIITNSTLATTAIGGGDESAWNTMMLPPSSLINGNNIIAVEIHQSAVTSSDISFNARLTGSTGALLTRGPYLQMLNPGGVTIRWRTNVPTNSRVEYGTSVAYGNVYLDTSLTTEHIVLLSGLSPQTKYFYRVGTSTQNIQGNSDNYFVTSAITGVVTPTRIWVTGDFGDGSISQAAVRDAFASYTSSSPANLWLWLGDNAYNTGTDAEYQSYVFNMYPNQFKNIPVYPSLGNHDYGNTGYQSALAMGTGSPYFNIFTLPQSAEAGGVASGTEKYYSYNNSNIHFIVLDSYGSYNTVGSAQYNWLQNDLAANTQRWTIVYFHHPPYTKGSHDSDTGVESIPIRQNFVPLFDTYNVDLVLSGHSHDNERSFLIHNHYGIANTFNASMKVSTETNTFTKSPPYDGTIYAVCGTSGRNPGTIQSGWPMPCMHFTNSTNNCSMIIDVNGDFLNAIYLTSQGTIADQFSITKTNARLYPEVEQNGIEIYPGSKAESFMVSFDLEKKSVVEIRISDTLGRIVNYAVKSKSLESGKNEIEIDKNNLKSGIYFLTLINEGNTRVRKVFINN